MRIAKLSAYQVRVPLRRKITHASFSRSESQSVVVRCELSDGTIGWGEAVPRVYVTGESVDSVFSQYENGNLSQILGESWEFLNELISLIQNISLPTMPDELTGAYIKRGCFGNAARCALEISLIDAATRAEGVSFSSIFSHVESCSDLLEPQHHVRYSGVLTSMKPVKQYLLALIYRATGFSHCKVKVGLQQLDDLELLRKLRSILGRAMNLRVDANEAWTRDVLEQKAAAMSQYRVSSIEQPVAHTNITSLRGLSGQLEIPVMLDESLCCPLDAEEAISNEYCEYFNLRISKLGGVLETLKIAQIASLAGLQYQLGCQVGETGILSAAGRHFASSIKGIQFLEGSFDRFLLKQNLIEEEISFGWGGSAAALTGPGLGITVNERRLRECSTCEQHWTFQ